MKSNSNKQPAPKAVHLYPTRRAVAESNRLYIEDHIKRTGAKLYESPALDINVKTGAPLTPELVWADPENTGGLEALFRVAIGARVMLRHNLDIQDGLVNGACGFVENIEADEDTGEIERIWVDFEKDAGAKVRRERDQLRCNHPPISHVPGHRGQQGLETAVPHGAREGHHHSQEPGGCPT